MHCDHYSKIGTRHRICQDYTVVNGPTEPVCAVLCDGCSSAPDTDFGARILAHQIRQKLPKYWNSDYGLAYNVGNSVNDLTFAVGLSREANFATCGYVFSNGQIIKTALFGDGVVYIRDSNDKESIFWIHFVDNTPYYPYYVHDAGINAAYIKGGHGKYTVVSITSDGAEKLAEEWISPTNPTTFIGYYPADNIKVLSVFSDGVDSFKHPADGQMPIIEIVDKLTSFKNYGGDFVYRRCMAAFREWEAEGVTWGDDFSMITLENMDG